jgi:Raf kinase inhibitor-like YbhB/YbcL family protein
MVGSPNSSRRPPRAASPDVVGERGVSAPATVGRAPTITTVRRHLALLLAVPGLVVMVLGASCSSDDDDAPSADEGPVTFEVTSAAFDEGDDIPTEHSLDGGNVSPPLEWVGVPSEADELAITVVDPDASNFVHWVVWGIEPTDARIEAGALPASAVAGPNQFGDLGWGGPAPPAGDEHTYVFTVHALSRAPGIDETTTAVEALQAIDGVTMATAELRGQFMSS